MHLSYHGGQCCGIKTIWGFWYHPDQNAQELEAIGLTDDDANGNPVRSSDRFYHLSAPEETWLQRFKRYLAYCDERRPRGIIEVVLADNQCGVDALALWAPVLLKHGFKLVNSNVNSNSENTCYVYHRNSNESGKDSYDYEDDYDPFFEEDYD